MVRKGFRRNVLWRFLLEELDTDNQDIRWVDKTAGTFRFIDTLMISKRWGERKKKEDMNFDKLSRAMRLYYKEGLMSREDGVRLVYRFHWRKIPRDERPCDVIIRKSTKRKKHEHKIKKKPLCS